MSKLIIILNLIIFSIKLLLSFLTTSIENTQSIYEQELSFATEF